MGYYNASFFGCATGLKSINLQGQDISEIEIIHLIFATKKDWFWLWSQIRGVIQLETHSNIVFLGQSHQFVSCYVEKDSFTAWSTFTSKLHFFPLE